jgi:3-deoxy-D-manno-octulosonic-acid transferase
VLAPHSLDPPTIEFFRRETHDYKHIILIEKMGILKYLYRYASLAYIGGAFGDGLHNLLEPAAYNIPVIFGPRHKKFPEAQEFLDLGSAITINDYKSFQEGVTHIFRKQQEIKECLDRYFADKKPDLAIILKKIEKTLHE